VVAVQIMIAGALMATHTFFWFLKKRDDGKK
jgi:hypothetical protein